MATSLLDAPKLRGFTGLVVLGEIKGDGSVVLRSDGPGVANVHNIQIVVEGHNDVGATSRLAVLNALGCFVLFEGLGDIVLISEVAALDDGLGYVGGELGVHYYVVMQVLL